MNYDLIIIKLTKPRLKQVIAHHIAADPSISLQKALSLLDNLPLVYKKDLSFEELEQASLQLQKLGAVCRAVESKNPLEKIEAGEKIPEKEVITSKEHKQDLTDSGVIYKRPAERTSERDTSFGTAPREKPAPKKKGVITNIIIFIGVALVIITVFLIGKGSKVRVKSTGPVLTGRSGIKPEKVKRSSTAKAQTDNDEETMKTDRSKGREASASPAKRSSDAYTDSAVHLCQDYECEIKFFRIALSFNRYNLRAWQGLIAAYRGAGRRAEAEKAERQMKKLFGEKVLNVEDIVKPYGVLSRYDRDEKGVCRIEYHSQSFKQSDLEKETYYLIKAFIAQQNCTMVSLYASTGKGKGMLVRVKVDRFPSRIPDYVKRASISFIE